MNNPTEEALSTGGRAIPAVGWSMPLMFAENSGIDDRNAKNWLAAIVQNSSDAILSKTLDGIITSWNAGAERLFGYTASEVIGHPITTIIPESRLFEETEIIGRLRRGERIEQFETVRRRKDGSAVEVELTISPVRNEAGEIIGASKIARDIGERRRQAAAQKVLVREMSHRIKNLLSIVQALVRLGRKEKSVETFANDLCDRVSALARAHDLILEVPDTPSEAQTTTLDLLLGQILLPYFSPERVKIAVPAQILGRGAVTSLALIFHEYATNAVKYGGLSGDAGRLAILGRREGDQLILSWQERGGQAPGDNKGFGTTLLRAALLGLDGKVEQHWDGEQGFLELRLTLSIAKLAL
jgi:PAS domain S-box-containing protein